MTPVTDSVPFVDLESSIAPIKDDVLGDLLALLESCGFTNGAAVREFEAAFAEYVGVSSCVGVASGLDALRLALQTQGIGPGDEVVVPAMTFVATWEAVSQVGATPVPVDVSLDDACMTAAAASAAFTPATRAVLPVHLYGRIADPSGYAELTAGGEVFVLEDACQAHGATRGGLTAGAIGHAAAFSFYPSKNLGAAGDAGALVTPKAELAREMISLREHGQAAKYEHDRIGWTARLDTVQAAVLLRKLPHLDRWNDERRAAAAWYGEALADVGDLRLPLGDNTGSDVWHLYVVLTADPTGLAAHLADLGVATGRHYPQPPHLSEAYRSLGYAAGDFPAAERIARECLSLPIYPGIGEAQLERVVDGVRSWFSR